MYRVLKEKGHNMNVVLGNMDTKASIIIGKLTMDILDILKKEGYRFNDDSEESLKLNDEWNLKVSDETAKALSKKTMRMSKPTREVIRKVEEPAYVQYEGKDPDNKKIDAMDVLLGLANYSK